MTSVFDFVVPGLADHCWDWDGNVNKHDNDRPVWDGVNAARAIWFELYGEPPEGFHVEHICENRACVNPLHLDAVHPDVNYARLRIEKCKRGHEMTEGNICNGGKTPLGKPKRKCRTCTQAREKVRSKRRALARKGGQ